MCGVRKLTHTAYANQRMTLNLKLRQSKKSKRNTMIALRGQSTWRVFIIHVLNRAFGDASIRRECMGTRHFFLRRRGGEIGARNKRR